MSFFEELTRRNVFRVGIAYAVGAWLLLQFTEVLSELLDLPKEVGPTVVALVAIGLPIALFFAWAYELTPEGIKKERDVDRSESITHQTGRKLDRAIIAMLVLVAAYFIWESRFAERAAPVTSNEPVATQAATTEPGAEKAQVSPAPEVDRQSIAVLPFTNRSRLEEDEFFVEGIHDDLLTNLARIGSLKVISRTSVLRFKDTQKPIPEIAGELGVATVMEGAVQRAGDTVRINVQLIDARTDEHLWAEIFDRELTAENLFAIQSEISARIAEALEATLSPEEQQRIADRPTDNLAAYNAYLRGRQAMARRNSADLYRALEEFQRAVELDPGFALAWVGVAESAYLLPGYSNADPLEMIRIQEEAVEKALAINDELGEAYLSLANVHEYYERWEEAEAAHIRAIELSPNYATAYHWYADFMNRWVERAGESLRLIRKAVELDPLSSILQLEVAEKLNLLGRFGEAEAQLNRLFINDPNFAPAYSMMATVQENLGRFDRAVHWLRKSKASDPGRLQTYMDEALALLNLGDTEQYAKVKEQVASIDAEHFSNGWLDLLQALYAEQYPAALESTRWLAGKIGQQPSFQITFGYVQLMAGNIEEARAAFERGEPRFFDRDSWEAAIEQQVNTACDVAWVMGRTGDASMGRELLQKTIRYMEDELPRYVEHSDRYGFANCYAVAGEFDRAIDAFETQVDHGHFGFWWLFTRMPYFEPLRGTPRFEAAIAQIAARTERQRARLSETEAEAES